MKVQIIARPAGQAPEWVRDAWIGVQFEAERDNPNDGSIRRGVLGGKTDSENIGGYSVEGSVVIAALEKINPEAAKWWRKNTMVAYIGSLVFGAKFCKEIE